MSDLYVVYGLELILEEHIDLAVCYAMKEEMCRLFDLKNAEAVREGWLSWLETVKVNGIEPLMKFAENKEIRLEGRVDCFYYHFITSGMRK